MRLIAPTPIDGESLETDVTDLKVFVRSMIFTSAGGTIIHKGMKDETLLTALEMRIRSLIQVLNLKQVPRISDSDERLARNEAVERTEEHESLIVRDLDLPPFKGTVEDFELAMDKAQNEASLTKKPVVSDGKNVSSFRGRIVGNAQIRYRAKDWADGLPPANPAPAPENVPEGMNMDLAIIFDKAYKDLELSCMKGQAYYFVDQMGAVASHTGQGIGKALMKWVSDRADRDGVPVFVIASPVGLPFYLKIGFEKFGPDATFDVDLKPYGGSIVYRHTAVIKQPASRSC